MCIIAYAPKDVAISDSTIRTMFSNNPDGAGIMWKSLDGVVEIRKGFFSIDKLLRAWHNIPVGCEKAIHCRIATAGRITATCCHPFPVRGTTESMGYKVDHCDIAMMHNGIINLTDPPLGMYSPYSDTMMFAKEILYNVKDGLDNEYVQEMLEDAINHSRMLIFRSNSTTIRLGNWVKDGKVFYSNTSYRPYYSYYSSYTGIGTTVSTPVQTTVSTPVETAGNPCSAFGYDEDPDLYDAQGNFLFDDETRYLDEQTDDVKDGDLSGK